MGEGTGSAASPTGAVVFGRMLVLFLRTLEGWGEGGTVQRVITDKKRPRILRLGANDLQRANCI
jgi:hypothetical protein